MIKEVTVGDLLPRVVTIPTTQEEFKTWFRKTGRRHCPAYGIMVKDKTRCPVQTEVENLLSGSSLPVEDAIEWCKDCPIRDAVYTNALELV